MDKECFCVDCGQYTTRRGPFGERLCEECHHQQDSDIDDRERAIADRYGYSKEFSNKEWTKKSTIN
jgi:hypothetical protein